MNKEIQHQKGNISRKTARHKIESRNTAPSVTFAGIAGHVAGISGHVHRNTHLLIRQRLLLWLCQCFA